MKKNIFSFIGSLCSVATLIFLKAPYIIYSSSSGETKTVNFSGILGISMRDQVLTYDYLTFKSLFTLLSIFLAILSIFLIIRGNAEMKDYNGLIMTFSIVNLFNILLQVSYVTIYTYSYYDEYIPGWGFYGEIILFSLSFIFNLIGYIVVTVKNKKMFIYDKILSYKKLYEDEIISKEEYNYYKTRLLEKLE